MSCYRHVLSGNVATLCGPTVVWTHLSSLAATNAVTTSAVTISGGLHCVARSHVLMGVLAALLFPNWGCKGWLALCAFLGSMGIAMTWAPQFAVSRPQPSTLRPPPQPPSTVHPPPSPSTALNRPPSTSTVVCTPGRLYPRVFCLLLSPVCCLLLSSVFFRFGRFCSVALAGPGPPAWNAFRGIFGRVRPSQLNVSRINPTNH